VSNFMKISPVGAALINADRQTDRQTEGQTDITNLLGAYYDCVKEHKNGRL
jgi:hypothetical protein